MFIIQIVYAEYNNLYVYVKLIAVCDLIWIFWMLINTANVVCVLFHVRIHSIIMCAYVITFLEYLVVNKFAIIC